jgi:uncharacterized protein (DUF952 family)
VRLTFHLVGRARWEADRGDPWSPDSLATEGFVHCTDGMLPLVEVANRYYRDTPGELLVLTVDLAACGSPWQFDDPSGIYPHIYGPVSRHAVVAVDTMPRGHDGAFVPLPG